MSDTRHKDKVWNIGEITNGVTWDQVHAALAMDLRDELKQLNRTFSCSNFLEIPRTLRGIRIAAEGLRRDRKQKKKIHRRGAQKES